MTRSEAQAVAQRLLAGAEVLRWYETSAEHPLWSAGDEHRVVEVRWMKTGAFLRRRVERTRTREPDPVTWETHHRPDWLELALEAVPTERLAWLARGKIVVKS